MAFDRHTYGQNSNYTELIVEDEENFNLEEDLNHAILFYQRLLSGRGKNAAP